ncbi:MAG: DMT family transporter [Thermoplasmatota archaeon]
MAGSNPKLSYAAFGVACLIWGSTFFVISEGESYVPPEFAATLRLVIAAAVLSTVVLLVPGYRFPRGRALGAAALYGILNFGIDLGLLYWGEQTVPSGAASIFFATIPLSAFLFAWAIGQEHPQAWQVGGAAIAVFGVAVIFSGELTTAASPVSALRLLAVLGAATAASLSAVILKWGPPQDAIPANAVGAACGAVTTLAFSLFLHENQAIPSTWAAWWPVLYLTAFGSLGAYLLWSWLLKTWKASSAGMVAVVVPVLANLLQSVAAPGKIPALTFVGGAFVIAGVFVVLRNPGPDREPKRADAQTENPRIDPAQETPDQPASHSSPPHRDAAPAGPAEGEPGRRLTVETSRL